jgi:hypothetical protein
MEVHQNIKSKTIISPSISLLYIYIYPKTLKSSSVKDACTHPPCLCSTIHSEKRWEQTECLSTGEQIKKMWDIHNMQCSSAVKRMQG